MERPRETAHTIAEEKGLKVSWVRRRDWHILTSATQTYTNDERFQVIHNEGSEDWVLQIKYVQRRDNGAYECQVATGKGRKSHFFNLDVMVPTAVILGTGEVHVGYGSDISLICIIENSPTPPQLVMWYHNGEMINYEEDKTVRLLTKSGGQKAHSRLVISEARAKHSGNYTCTATNTDPDSVYVFVSTEEDNIAAIQRANSSGRTKPGVLLFMLAALKLITS